MWGKYWVMHKNWKVPQRHDRWDALSCNLLFKDCYIDYKIDHYHINMIFMRIFLYLGMFKNFMQFWIICLKISNQTFDFAQSTSISPQKRISPWMTLFCVKKNNKKRVSRLFGNFPFNVRESR